MKVIKYKVVKEYDYGTPDKPDVQQDIHEAQIEYTGDASVEFVRKEAYNGEYEILDDGQPEPELSRKEQLETDVAELKEAVDLLLSGVTE